jgi:hypothetical protein
MTYAPFMIRLPDAETYARLRAEMRAAPIAQFTPALAMYKAALEQMRECANALAATTSAEAQSVAWRRFWEAHERAVALCIQETPLVDDPANSVLLFAFPAHKSAMPPEFFVRLVRDTQSLPVPGMIPWRTTDGKMYTRQCVRKLRAQTKK